MADSLVKDHELSERQACNALRISRNTYRYKSVKRNDEPIIDALNELVTKHPTIGFWNSYYRLRRGFCWNHKRVYRVYTHMGLNIRRRARKRLPARVKQALFQPSERNQVWSMDFMSDSLWDGRTYRLLNILDDYNREMLRIVADISLPALRVTRALEELAQERGLPQMIRVDNGPEFISRQLDVWCRDRKIQLAFIQPGKPMQNGFIERCNGSIRRELLNAYVFRTLDDVRELSEKWRMDYNTNRPHKALNYRSPIELLNNAS
jgi:putative transposase